MLETKEAIICKKEITINSNNDCDGRMEDRESLDPSIAMTTSFSDGTSSRPPPLVIDSVVSLSNAHDGVSSSTLLDLYEAANQNEIVISDDEEFL